MDTILFLAYHATWGWMYLEVIFEIYGCNSSQTFAMRTASCQLYANALLQLTPDSGNLPLVLESEEKSYSDVVAFALSMTNLFFLIRSQLYFSECLNLPNYIFCPYVPVLCPSYPFTALFSLLNDIFCPYFLFCTHLIFL